MTAKTSTKHSVVHIFKDNTANIKPHIHNSVIAVLQFLFPSRSFICVQQTTELTPLSCF